MTSHALILVSKHLDICQYVFIYGKFTIRKKQDKKYLPNHGKIILGYDKYPIFVRLRVRSYRGLKLIFQMAVNFMCLFPKNQGIASKSPVGDLTPEGIEQIALWENFDLSFGRQSLAIGDRNRSKHFSIICS